FPSAPLRLFPWRLTSPGQQSKLDRNVTIAASIRLTKGSCMRNLHPFLSAGVLLCLSLPAYPQSDRGVLTGTVTDSSGAVIPGASVTATNTATNVSASTVTTEGGFYAIPALQPGTYKVRVELTGFKAYEQSQVVIAAATTVRVDAKLERGAQPFRPCVDYTGGKAGRTRRRHQHHLRARGRAGGLLGNHARRHFGRHGPLRLR